MLTQERGRGARAMPGSQVTSLIYGALVRMVGRTNADAIEFYVDTRLAVEDPPVYEQSVKSLLGEHGGCLVIEGLKTELAKRSGIEGSSESFFSHVRAAERSLRTTKHVSADTAVTWV